jgi:hypothetical protein
MKKLLTLFATLAISFALTAAAYGQSPGVSNFRADLSGAEEVPDPVDTATTGSAKLKVRADTIEFTLDIRNADGILGAAGAHIHCGEAGTNGPVVAFLAAVVPGGFDGKVKLNASLTGDNIVNPACGETVAELAESMREGGTYVNVHSIANPGGEVRGQIRPVGN